MSCRTKKQIFWDNIQAHREMVAKRKSDKEKVVFRPPNYLPIVVPPRIRMVDLQ